MSHAVINSRSSQRSSALTGCNVTLPPATELPAAVFALMVVGSVAVFALVTVLLDRK